jgi:thymidylate synthase ThyX
MIEVKGKSNISAKIIAHSIANGKEILTYELEYPRFVHAEFMTHRQFSRNAASSRAIPVKKLIGLVRNSPATPVHWGQNQSGMQAKSELQKLNLWAAKKCWKGASKVAASVASLLNKIGLHKQITNRILEPFQMIKVVVTATEYENFFYLRNHKDAQPEIEELARCMYEARVLSYPNKLKAGEWHLPYITTKISKMGIQYSCGDIEVSLQEAIMLSASLCAQVSYRKADESLDKAFKIYDQLVTMKPVHASPFEHQATPINIGDVNYRDITTRWPEGTTHMDRTGALWSGNFKGWIQNRQLIKDHVYTGDRK